MTAITEVWVVQEEDGSVASVQAEEPRARVVRDLRQLGNTVTRVEVLTPEMAAVIDAAVAWLDVGGGSLVELVFAVKNLRKQEAQP